MVISSVAFSINATEIEQTCWPMRTMRPSLDAVRRRQNSVRRRRAAATEVAAEPLEFLSRSWCATGHAFASPPAALVHPIIEDGGVRARGLRRHRREILLLRVSSHVAAYHGTDPPTIRDGIVLHDLFFILPPLDLVIPNRGLAPRRRRPAQPVRNHSAMTNVVMATSAV
jgi:hypothetical protein